jgi:subtilase family serine protease
MFVKIRLWRVLCGLGLLGALEVCPVFGADLKILPGHVPREILTLKSTGRLAATNEVRLAIGVPLRDPAGLDDFLAQVYDPANPNYRHYLTPAEFTARFGPTEPDYAAVKQFALTNGLTITATHDNRLLLDVIGPAAAVEKALHVKLQTYQHPTEARQFFAPDTEPTVAASLPVADVQGLSDFVKPHPRLKKAEGVVSPRTGSGSGGAYLGNDFRNAYASGTTLTGAGQMVGLLQFDGFYASDIAKYASAAGGGRTNIVIQTVLLDGYNGTPTSGADSGNGEVSLDIEMAMAMAPGLAKIVVFEGGPNGFQNDVLNSMAANSAVKNLSCSWGWGGGPSTTTDNIFKQMASQGQSFFNASGDSDAFTVGATSLNGVDNSSSANAPSSSPYITQVGGTTLTMSAAGGSFVSEKVWNWGGGSGSSGGVSSSYSIPSWQTSVNMTANLGSTTQRNIPDVAMTADNVFVYYGRGSGGTFGGTSCAAPLWAGFMALVNQQAAALGNAPAGLINPAVYAIGNGQIAGYGYSACFHDTTTGNNFWSASPAKYPAVTGYDLCTGWGTPNGASLINALAGSAPVAGLGVSPQSGFAASGPAGGPFTPAAGTIQLTNTSGTALNWSLASTSAWFKVTFTNGTLAGNAAMDLPITVTAAADSLKIGSYSTFLAFTDQSTHLVQNLPATLQVYQPMSVSPAKGFTAIGPVGGTFTPSSQSFVLANLSGSAFNWSLIKTSAWLTVSATNGSLAAGSQTTLTVSLSSSTKTLRAAVYNSSITFTNLSGLVAVVPFTLSIGQPLVLNGGFENGNFSDWTQSGNTDFTTVVGSNPYYVHGGTHGAELGPSGTPGYLSQTVPTTPGQTYRLSLWLRNATGRVPNTFQVQWNGSTVSTLQNLATTGWTNLQFLVTADSLSSLLQFGFQDDPYYLGLDDISLTAVVNPGIRSVVRPSGDFQLVWNTATGMVYQVQYKTNLLQADWINLGSAITARTDTLTLTDTNAFKLSPQRFYRLTLAQ